jgi:hypothetical protein
MDEKFKIKNSKKIKNNYADGAVEKKKTQFQSYYRFVVIQLLSRVNN